MCNPCYIIGYLHLRAMSRCTIWSCASVANPKRDCDAQRWKPTRDHQCSKRVAGVNTLVNDGALAERSVVKGQWADNASARRNGARHTANATRALLCQAARLAVTARRLVVRENDKVDVCRSSRGRHHGLTTGRAVRAQRGRNRHDRSERSLNKSHSVKVLIIRPETNELWIVERSGSVCQIRRVRERARAKRRASRCRASGRALRTSKTLRPSLTLVALVTLVALGAL